MAESEPNVFSPLKAIIGSCWLLTHQSFVVMAFPSPMKEGRDYNGWGNDRGFYFFNAPMVLGKCEVSNLVLHQWGSVVSFAVQG